MSFTIHRNIAPALALSLGLVLGGCSAYASNQQLESLKQPVIERTNYTLDVNAGPEGMSFSEQQRVDDWFAAMDLRHGDRVSIDDPMASSETRRQVAALASRHGILINDGAPVTAGYVQPGQARVVVTRSTAHVPNCPDWSVQMEANQANATHSNYGCSTNSNLAAMVANPEDLLSGQSGTGETIVTTSTKAIKAYREADVTGSAELAAESTTGGN